MDDDPVLHEAALVVDTEHARHRADIVAAFWQRLKKNGVPPADRREFTIHEFWSYTDWDDD